MFWVKPGITQHNLRVGTQTRRFLSRLGQHKVRTVQYSTLLYCKGTLRTVTCACFPRGQKLHRGSYRLRRRYSTLQHVKCRQLQQKPLLPLPTGSLRYTRSKVWHLWLVPKLSKSGVAVLVLQRVSINENRSLDSVPEIRDKRECIRRRERQVPDY